MIRLRNRGPAPAALARNRQRWTDRWVRVQPHGGDWATRGAKKLLREALLKLSHGKCAYCEVLLNVSSFPQIDHYTSKFVRIDLAFDWTNLLPTCEICNVKKGRQDHANQLLNPTQEDPELLLWLDIGTGELKPNPFLEGAVKERVRATINDYCDLNRPPRPKLRYEYMRRVARLMSRAPMDADAADELSELLDPQSQFKFVLRRTLELHGAPQLAHADRARFHA